MFNTLAAALTRRSKKQDWFFVDVKHKRGPKHQDLQRLRWLSFLNCQTKRVDIIVVDRFINIIKLNDKLLLAMPAWTRAKQVYVPAVATVGNIRRIKKLPFTPYIAWTMAGIILRI